MLSQLSSDTFLLLQVQRTEMRREGIDPAGCRLSEKSFFRSVLRLQLEIIQQRTINRI